MALTRLKDLLKRMRPDVSGSLNGRRRTTSRLFVSHEADFAGDS